MEDPLSCMLKSKKTVFVVGSSTVHLRDPQLLSVFLKSFQACALLS